MGYTHIHPNHPQPPCSTSFFKTTLHHPWFRHRLLANVAISPSAGPTLAASSAVSEPLLDMLGAKRISDSEELVGDLRQLTLW